MVMDGQPGWMGRSSPARLDQEPCRPGTKNTPAGTGIGHAIGVAHLHRPCAGGAPKTFSTGKAQTDQLEERLCRYLYPRSRRLPVRSDQQEIPRCAVALFWYGPPV